jgi:hypothetical protein
MKAYTRNLEKERENAKKERWNRDCEMKEKEGMKAGRPERRKKTKCGCVCHSQTLAMLMTRGKPKRE